MNVTERIAALRSLMKKNGIDAYLITGTDPHLSEYTPERWKTRAWISGFTGSFGKVLVTLKEVLLWTDTRYFLQASDELYGTGIRLMKERVVDAISLESWVVENLKPGSKFALDGLTLSTAEAVSLKSILGANGIFFDSGIDLVAEIWQNRPSEIYAPIYEHPANFAGKTRAEKLELVRKMLLAKEIDAAVVSMLDDVAWLYNLRGNEIEYTPLFSAYAYVDLEKCWLFIASKKLSATISAQLEQEGIQLAPYDEFLPFLSRILEKCIQIDPIRSNFQLTSAMSGSNIIDTSVSLTTLIKSVKEPMEIRNIRNAHLKDGVALVNFLFWLNHTIEIEDITEVSAGKMLFHFRSRQAHFVGESFCPIVGFGPHGAIVHYHATESTDVAISKHNLLLIDSGGQYLDGTTDLTRTICLGHASKEQKMDFTLCLKAHIALANAIFPEGTRGHSLDAIARNTLWNSELNYGHGTGHGIGYFLSVHEGPMSIRAEFNNQSIREGHLLSNEPGIYRTDKYGIRIENVILCREFSQTEFGKFLCFETISLCPIDKQLIIIELLCKEELNWINQYHEKVFQQISPLITEKVVLEWLKNQCLPLN